MTDPARAFVASNLPILCGELVKWRQSGWLHAGSIRQLQGLLTVPVNSMESLPMCEAMITTAACLDVVATYAKSRQKPAPSDDVDRAKAEYDAKHPKKAKESPAALPAPVKPQHVAL